MKSSQFKKFQGANLIKMIFIYGILIGNLSVKNAYVFNQTKCYTSS
jgi:hypothetical protein